jgi:CRP-like cAMP-binding protein
MTVPLEVLKSIPYFANLDISLLEAIRQVMFEKRAERGEIILLEGEPAQALFFIASGAVKVFKTSPEGKEQILAIVRPGESFNDISVFDDGPNPASAQAMGAVQLHGIGKEHIDSILRKRPEMALTVMKIMAKRVRQLVSLIEDLSFRRVVSRVAKILLEYSEERTAPRPRLTQQEIAGMAGTAREVVGRSFKHLEESGTIKIESHRIVIVNKEALRQIAMKE